MGWFGSSSSKEKIYFKNFDDYSKEKTTSFFSKYSNVDKSVQQKYSIIQDYLADITNSRLALIKECKAEEIPAIKTQYDDAYDKVQAILNGELAPYISELKTIEQAENQKAEQDALEMDRRDKEFLAEIQKLNRRKCRIARADELEKRKNAVMKSLVSAPPCPIEDILGEPIFYLDGRGANLYVYEDCIVLDRTAGGIFNMFNRTYKVIPIKYIIAVQVKSSGGTTGFLEVATYGHENTAMHGFSRIDDEDNINYSSEDSAYVAKAIVEYLLPKIIK